MQNLAAPRAAGVTTGPRLAWEQAEAHPALLILLLILIPCAVFSPSLPHGFVNWDDRPMVYENPFLHPVTGPHVLYFWRHAYYAQYAPLTYSAYALLAWIGNGPRPPLFHLAGLLLHVCNTLIVCGLLRRVVGRAGAAFAGALLFALHPAQAEPVCWVGGMDTELCALFSLLSLGCYLRFARSEATGARRWGQYGLATVFFGLALLSKPAAVALPLMAWALGGPWPRRPFRHSVGPLLVWLMAALAWVHVTQAASPFLPAFLPPVWTRPLIAGDALAFYLVKLVAPLPLAIDYGRTPFFVLHHGGGLLAGLLPLGLGALVWRGRHRAPWLLPASGVFVAALVPVLGLVPFAFQEYSTVADRYLYLAMLGPALALAGLLAVPQPRPAVTVAITTLALLAFAFQSAAQTRYWETSATLFAHGLSVNPRSMTLHYNLAEELSGQGRTEEAIAHYRAALQIAPGNAPAHCNLAGQLASLGRLNEAAAEYRTALALAPGLGPAHAGLGLVLAALKSSPSPPSPSGSSARSAAPARPRQASAASVSRAAQYR